MLFHSITSFSFTLQPWRNALIGWEQWFADAQNSISRFS
jgi:hypothetical protein